MKNEEYIEYVKSFDNDKINESLELFRNKNISFDEFEMVCIDEGTLSTRTYLKTFKLGSIFKG